MRFRYSSVLLLSIVMLSGVGLQPSLVYADSFWDTDSDDYDSSNSDWGVPSQKTNKSKTSAWEDESSKREDVAQNAETEESGWGTVNKKTDRFEKKVRASSISDDITGFELRAGVSVPVGATHLSVGVQGNVEIGYRWEYIGLYLQQNLGGNIYLKDDFYQKIKKGASAFSGSTYLTIKGLISSSTHKHYLSVIFGVGVTYGNFEYMPFIIPNDVSYPYSGFTLKAGLGYEYRITNDMTFGVSVEYMPYMVGGMKKDDYAFVFYHMVQPHIHFGYTF